eukprot:366196-Chlamydomonas_euryale.AAC.4
MLRDGAPGRDPELGQGGPKRRPVEAGCRTCAAVPQSPAPQRGAAAPHTAACRDRQRITLGAGAHVAAAADTAATAGARSADFGSGANEHRIGWVAAGRRALAVPPEACRRSCPGCRSLGRADAVVAARAAAVMGHYPAAARNVVWQGVGRAAEWGAASGGAFLLGPQRLAARLGRAGPRQPSSHIHSYLRQSREPKPIGIESKRTQAAARHSH